MTSASASWSLEANGQMPMPCVQCLIAALHVQPLRLRLLAGDDDVDAVPAAQAVVGHPQQGVGVGRQIDPHDVGLLVHHVVDEPRVLVAEPVMVLPPDMRRQQIVQRRDRPPPGDRARTFQPFGMLVHHRIDDVDERLVARQQPVPAGEQIPLQPPLAGMLAEDFHHPAARRQMVVLRNRRRVPGSVGHLQNVVQAVGVVLIG